jgi:16S rRNA processing protein RimM
MDTPDEAVVVGRVMGVHGVRGWVKVYSYTDPMDNILTYRPWWLESGGEWREVRVNGGKRHGKNLIAQLADCTDRNEALERFAGCRIAVPRSALPELDEDEFYWRDLLGLRVRLDDGRDLGVVATLMETGANDVLVVRGDADSLDRHERLIPWVPDEVIETVDPDAGILTVHWDPEF